MCAYFKEGDQSENFCPITWHVIRNLDGGKNTFVDIQEKPMAKASTNFDGNIKRNSKEASMTILNYNCFQTLACIRITRRVC